jgi:chromate transport protein ChrA
MVWSGWGLVGLLPAMFMIFGSQIAWGMVGDGSEAAGAVANGIGAAVGGVVGGIVLRIIAGRLEERDAWSEDSLFWIPLFAWPYLYWLGSVAALVTGIVVALQSSPI